MAEEWGIEEPGPFECGVCRVLGPWFLTCWWWDDIASTEAPGGGMTFLEPQARMLIACSMECGREFARAAGPRRLSITRHETDQKHRQWLIENLGRPERPVPAQAGPRQRGEAQAWAEDGTTRVTPAAVKHATSIRAHGNLSIPPSGGGGGQASRERRKSGPPEAGSGSGVQMRPT